MRVSVCTRQKQEKTFPSPANRLSGKEIMAVLPLLHPRTTFPALSIFFFSYFHKTLRTGMTKPANDEEVNVVKGPACSASNFVLIKFNSMTDDRVEKEENYAL